MKRVILFLCITTLFVACTSPIGNSNAPLSNADPLQNIVREYSSWAPLFQTARNVSGFLMALCRLPDENEQAYLESEHAQYFVQVYVNPIGTGTLAQEGARKFPDGTIIVKEKWAQDARLQLDKTARKPAGLGIMVKDKMGWQYAYVDEAGTITRDPKQLEHCRACHKGNAERDAVFYPAVLRQ